MVPRISYGDAVGNEVFALNDTIKRIGYNSMIYAESIDQRVPKEKVRSIRDWEEPDKDDVIIYHMAIRWDFIETLRCVLCKKMAIYHNITPPEFYLQYNSNAYENCQRGLDQVRSLSDVFDYCLADSNFNRQDLVSYGYRCPIDILPIVIPFDDYKKKPSESIIAQYSGKGTNILFVGRVAPNKRFEDVIAVFALYQKFYDTDAKLFLVGSYDEADVYYKRLKDYVKILKLSNVFFSGHIRFDEILAYYSIADGFLCMSEHEGFCVPLVEAMIFEIPIVALDRCAVKETLRDGGILLAEKDYPLIAGVLNRVIQDDRINQQIKKNQRRRLEHFRQDKTEKMFEGYMKAFIEQ